MKKEKPATKTCKHCKTEIPYGAKICPQCRKKQGPGGCLTAIIIVVVIGLIGSCVGGKSNEEDPSNTTVTTAQSNKSNQEEITAAPETTIAEKPLLTWVKLQILKVFKYHCLEQLNQKAQTS